MGLLRRTPLQLAVVTSSRLATLGDENVFLDALPAGDVSSLQGRQKGSTGKEDKKGIRASKLTVPAVDGVFYKS